MTKTDPHREFLAERRERVAASAQDHDWQNLSERWRNMAFDRRYPYNFDWLGRPIVQLPPDMVAVQDLIWQTRPDLIIETGIAHGGSLVLSASMLALLDLTDAVSAGSVLDPTKPRRRVLGLDIDIRAHNRAAIEGHPLHPWIEMREGSSIAAEMVAEVHSRAAGHERIMVCLDSNHTHDHVLTELEAYAPLVTPGCYCIVFDTVIEELPPEMYPDRPWAQGDNPATAIAAWLDALARDGTDAQGRPMAFEVDRVLDARIAHSSAPGGYLRRTL
ncbi:MAG: cephalosporin hydroxylase family protein [Roseinatronobacter sp.]